MDGLSEREILNFALQNGMIDIDTIQKKIEMNERKKYLEMHNHKIWQGKDGYFYTKVDDESAKGKRRMIKKSSRENLDNALIDFYKENQKEIYLSSVFYEWMDKKLSFGEIQRQTYERYEIDFFRFFKDSNIYDKKFRYITEDDLEDFIKTTIYQKKLTSKAFGNLRTLVNGIFKYAKKKGYTNISITSFFGDMDISKKSFLKVQKKEDMCVFNESEMENLIKYLSQNPKLGNLGVMFAAYTGMRVGEIVALKWEDITDKYINVCRTQIRFHGDDGKEIYEIRDFPKTEAGIRNVIIVEGLIPIIKKLRLINPFTEYVFVKNDKIITKHVLDMCLYRACDEIGIPRRGMHVLRKTYATRLLNAQVDEAVVINQMGHTDISTTKNYYYFNDKTAEKMSSMISNVINY